MPYVPSEKTNGKSQDRNIINRAVEKLSAEIVLQIERNNDVCNIYRNEFMDVARGCLGLANNDFADVILAVGAGYGYEGAFLGELNYGITRVIQRVPQILAQQGKCGLKTGKELRYWLYAMTVTALIAVESELLHKNQHYSVDLVGVAGVFEDIKDEYKVRVNKSYEIAQILKSGDCYDTPYFNKVVEIVDKDGKVVGHTYVELTNDGKNYKLDKMPFKIVVK